MTLEKLRARIEALAEERRTLKRNTLNPDETRAAVERSLTAAADQFRGSKLRRALSDAATRGGFSLTVDASDVLGLFAATLGPAKLAETLTLDVSRDVDDGPTVADRAQRVAEIDAELAKLGRDEERHIRAAEARGEHIPRRADADPSIVLAEVLR